MIVFLSKVTQHLSYSELHTKIEETIPLDTSLLTRYISFVFFFLFFFAHLQKTAIKLEHMIQLP